MEKFIGTVVAVVALTMLKWFVMGWCIACGIRFAGGL